MTPTPHLAARMATRFAATGALLLATTATTAAGLNDDGAHQLAAKAGCPTCHAVERGAKGPEGLPPIGPAWRDVALKYKGQKGAEDALTKAVLLGSNPYDSHWKGKASGLAMPPNAVAIGKDDARKLVGWILKLDPK
ncbi:c-type cytochrome [Sphaerotilus mobilis]|uniref:Cytochrome c n=1 Tax=Sphaerotilus mobilis TaxID=47994 RepID=A0A4Q7LTU1_9BURK|nr:c-type cytochrome [Sphaerotilus mobilis]RZS58436.1 cytochrome c [Sphaerotilus mobilis]